MIPVPEVTDWQPLSENDSFLVVASDGVFERMTPMDVCKLLWDVPMDMDDSSLGEYIVNAAYKGGSTDNLSAIVIPLTKSHEKCEQGFCSFVKPGNLFMVLHSFILGISRFLRIERCSYLTIYIFEMYQSWRQTQRWSLLL